MALGKNETTYVCRSLNSNCGIIECYTIETVLLDPSLTLVLQNAKCTSYVLVHSNWSLRFYLKHTYIETLGTQKS